VKLSPLHVAPARNAARNGPAVPEVPQSPVPIGTGLWGRPPPRIQQPDRITARVGAVPAPSSNGWAANERTPISLTELLTPPPPAPPRRARPGKDRRRSAAVEVAVALGVLVTVAMTVSVGVGSGGKVRNPALAGWSKHAKPEARLLVADATRLERDSLTAARGDATIATPDLSSLQEELAAAGAIADPPDPQVALSWGSGIDRLEAAVQSLEAAGATPSPGTALTAAGQLQTAIGDLGDVLSAS
jgi:hypothetical protein